MGVILLCLNINMDVQEDLNEQQLSVKDITEQDIIDGLKEEPLLEIRDNNKVTIIIRVFDPTNAELMGIKKDHTKARIERIRQINKVHDKRVKNVVKEKEEKQVVVKLLKKRRQEKEEQEPRLSPPPKKDKVIIIPAQEYVKELTRRVKKGDANVLIKPPQYFMNNRERFINFINRVFDNYKKEINDESKQVTCEDLQSGNNTKFSLLTHQKLVRDYLNLYTPYRGLLLYFGLGAGKTCTSISIAEGISSQKRIIVMTPASLRKNYMEELKKCGDEIFRKNQFWEWIPLNDSEKRLNTLSSILKLDVDFIRNQGGAWMVDHNKEANLESLSQEEVKRLNVQLEEMIKYKYQFISYNGLRRDHLKKMTNNYQTNIFDNKTIIIDEVHNFISRIANKLEKTTKKDEEKDVKKKPLASKSLSLVLYELLMSARNCRIVVLTGTPIINYPIEVAILFNILRGYIKTWEIQIDDTISREALLKLFKRDKNVDYIDYASNKVLTVTRNPMGFESKYLQGEYRGVSSEKTGTVKKTGKEVMVAVKNVSDEEFINSTLGVLRDNSVKYKKVDEKVFKALPDKEDAFTNMFIDGIGGRVKNIMLFKRRILGLTSYYKSAQESLMPKYDKLLNFHKVVIPMSNYQFGVYEMERTEERKQEKSQKTNSTYKIFSRLVCNYAMPVPPGRPKPSKKGEVVEKLDDNAEDADEDDAEDEADGDEEGEGEKEGVAELYSAKIQSTLEYLQTHEEECLSKGALMQYSPKFLNILENVMDEENVGLHLLYTQFRTLEGVALFKLVLEANGFAEFKVKKNEMGIWDLDIEDYDMHKPKFALYTGTESAEEKEIIRNIYNSNWDSNSLITQRLRGLYEDNYYGQVIKLLMITASGSEGINLKNTRYVHICEPYWNPTRIDQVVGRARRICSHTDLLEEYRTVEVFIYLMTFTAEQMEGEKSIELKRKDLSKLRYVYEEGNGYVQSDDAKAKHIPMTTDETLYEISRIKENVSMKFTTAIKEASIDCSIYGGTNCMMLSDDPDKFAFVPNYEKEETDKSADLNKTKIVWRAKKYVYGDNVYAYKEIDPKHGELYDYDAYMNGRAVLLFRLTHINGDDDRLERVL